jgi:hypothetical protein
MKNIITLILLVILSTMSFSQQTNSTATLTKQDYLQKSKNKKTGGWVLLGAGSVIAILGIADISEFSTTSSSSSNTFPGTGDYSEVGGGFITGIGLTGMAGSILFFISAKKFKAKAMSVSFKMQQTPQLQISNSVNRLTPTLNLKISL